MDEVYDDFIRLMNFVLSTNKYLPIIHITRVDELNILAGYFKVPNTFCIQLMKRATS